MHSFVEEFFSLDAMYWRFIYVLHVSVCSFLILSIPEQECASLFIQSATGGTWWIQGVRERMILSLQNKNTS